MTVYWPASGLPTLKEVVPGPAANMSWMTPSLLVVALVAICVPLPSNAVTEISSMGTPPLPMTVIV